MATKKRSSGRVTPKRSPRLDDNALATGNGEASRPTRAKHRVEREAQVPRRYTPPAPKVRFRPQWHRLVGWIGVALGIVVFALNEAMRFSENLTLLPFGHSPLYLILGLAIAASSTWFLGLFDRETTIYR